MDRKANAPARGKKPRLKLSCRMKANAAAVTMSEEFFYSTSTESLSKKSSSIRGILSLAGHKSCGSTRNALARQSNSKSETHRNCVSILARVCRLKSHPQRRQRAASIGCVNCCWSRNHRICGPTRLRGFFFMFRHQSRNNRSWAIFKGSEFRTTILLARKQNLRDNRRKFQQAENFLTKNPN